MINPKDITLRPASLADYGFHHYCKLPFTIMGTTMIEFKGDRIGHLNLHDFPAIPTPHEKPAIVVSRIEILPAYRRQGVGIFVMRSVLSKAREQQTLVILDVYQGNSAAISFHKKLGFVQIGPADDEILRMSWRAERAEFAPVRPGHPAP